MASVEGSGKEVIYVSSNDILMFFCNSTPITSIKFSEGEPAEQCNRHQVVGWENACHAQSFSCSASGNDIDVTLN